MYTNIVQGLSFKLGNIINKSANIVIYKGTYKGRECVIKQIPHNKFKYTEYYISNTNKFYNNLIDCLSKINSSSNTYLILPYYKNSDLMTNNIDNLPLKEDKVKNNILQMTKCIDNLNKRGFVHLDVKMENFVLDDSNGLVMIDFANVEPLKFGEIYPLHTKVGTEKYMSPEVSSGYYSKKSDIWSLGVSMYIMLTGRYLYENIDKYINVKNVDNYVIPKIEGLSIKGRDLLENMLKTNIIDRYNTDDILKSEWFDE